MSPVVGLVRYVAPRVCLSTRSEVSVLSVLCIRATVARDKPGLWCSLGVGTHRWEAWEAHFGPVILLVSMCSQCPGALETPRDWLQCG